MSNENTTAVYIKGVPIETHALLTAEAKRRGIKLSEMYVLTVHSGMKRIKVGGK